MAPPLFAPSSFWVFARRALSWRFVVSLVIIAGMFEVVSRLSPWVVGRVVHQQYLVSQRICELECTNQGLPINWLANERGARGDLYHGQTLRIAALGSSTTASSMLDQEETWPEHLKNELGAARVHIDNYAREGASYREAIRILDRIAEHGPHYDIILVMMHMSTRDAQESGEAERNAFHFWGQWVPPRHGMLVAPSLLRSRVSEQIKQEPRTEALWNAVSSLMGSPPAKAPVNPALSRSNRELRNAGKVELADVDITFTAEEEDRVRENTRRMLQAAARTSARVYLVLQPIAYDDDEVPEVARRWFSLYPVEGRENVFLSNRSVAQGLRRINDIMEEEAAAAGIPVIDLDRKMRPLLRQRGDLFDDKWHFAPEGAATAGELLADHLRQEAAAMAGHPLGARGALAQQGNTP